MKSCYIHNPSSVDYQRKINAPVIEHKFCHFAKQDGSIAQWYEREIADL